MSRSHDLHDDGVMEDLVEWVGKIAHDAIAVTGQVPEDVAETIVDEIVGSFEDLLVNHYGED